MLKAGKTNTTRLFCLIFEIFRGGIPEGWHLFCCYPRFGGWKTRGFNHIYT